MSLSLQAVGITLTWWTGFLQSEYCFYFGKLIKATSIPWSNRSYRNAPSVGESRDGSVIELGSLRVGEMVLCSTDRTEPGRYGQPFTPQGLRNHSFRSKELSGRSEKPTDKQSMERLRFRLDRRRTVVQHRGSQGRVPHSGGRQPHLASLFTEGKDNEESF